MNIDRDKIEANLRLHVDRLAGLIGVRMLEKPKTIQATIGYIEGQWAEMGHRHLLLKPIEWRAAWTTSELCPAAGR